MKKFLQTNLRVLLCAGILLLVSYSGYASHIVGAELRYKWIGLTPADQTYEVTVFLYGDCGPASMPAFGSLPTSAPQVCVYDGTTLVTTLNLAIQAPNAGLEVTPVCPDSLLFTQCTNPSYSLPGIKKFVYTNKVTLPHTSPVWRLVYTGNNGPGTTAGRAAAITNIIGPGGTTMQLIDTLNNSATNTRGNNSSPVLTVEPVPYFCGGYEDCYNPGAVDLYDTSYISEPAGDSMIFQLVPPTNGNAGCGVVGGPIGYASTQCPGGPACTGREPLSLIDCTPSSFSFDSSTGQLCFKPISPQRSVVVYNIEEYRNDTIGGFVNKVLVGTMQREMTFLIKTCTYTTPTVGINSFTGAGDTLDGTHYYGCANSGDFVLNMNPVESDPTLNMTITATGLPTGFVFAVTSNGTPTASATVSANTGTVLPGLYTFYVTVKDNHCPLSGSNTVAFHVQILPVPTIRDSLIIAAACDHKAAYMIFPGGTGKPWTMKFWHSSIPDTFQVVVDSLPFVDSLAPGMDQGVTIFTSVSNQCAVPLAIPVDTPHFNTTFSLVSPDYCGAADGYIVVHDLHPGKLDTVKFGRDGVNQPPQGFIATAGGLDTIHNLLAGRYYAIVYEGYCATQPMGPIDLINPPFQMGTVTGVNPTKCGFCNGIDTIWGLHPGQLDTITYQYLPFGSPTPTAVTVSHFITSDSIVVLSGLCEGTYSNFFVNTSGVCTVNCCTVVLTAPPISDSFRYDLHYGCRADTIMFTNRSNPPAELYYHWDFGDGSTAGIPSPTHIYTNTTDNSVTVELDITNTKCVDTFKQTIYLNNFLHASYTMDPPEYVCQLNPVTFTNTSTGVSPVTNAPPTYTWLFGDGATDNTFSPVHTFTNTNAYSIKLIAANTVPCYDTFTRILQVDSISILSIQATDSVICRGQGITFRGIYTSIGDTGNTWSFGDANGIVNINPIMHSYDDTGLHTVSLTALYRACPQESSSRVIKVIEHPDLYLGPDLAICPGGNALVIGDDRNKDKTNVRWRWNTGDTTSSILVTQPGYYSAMVTLNGCSSSDTVWVQKDCYMDIPNVFTPNGDGTNDYFYPRQLLTKGLVKFKMDIYNRWGQLIYETTNTDGRGWDGKMNDVPQPGGVYVYMIEATYKDGQIEHHQGNVTLLK